MTRYPPANLKPHTALANTPQIAAADISPQYNPNAKHILALRMPDGSNLIVAGRTRHQIALADPTCKAVKTTLIDYDPAIHTDDWVHMTNAGEHIINRTATTEHFATYFTHNPITHAQSIEQGLVPIDPKTGAPSAAYIKGRQLAEQHLAPKAATINQDTGSFSLRAKQDLTFTSNAGLKASEVKQSLERLAGQKLTCFNSPIVASVNSRQRGKLVSPAAREKSVANGFTQQQHLTLAARVDDLYKYAMPLGEYIDKNGRANLKAVFRFASPVIVDGKTAFALLTLKRVDKDNLYSLELEEINQLGGTLDRLNHLLKEEPSTIPLRAAEDIVAELASKVKEYFGENALPPITATQAAPLFQDGVMQAANAIVTQPTFSIRALHASPHNFRKFSTDHMGSGTGGQWYGWGLYFTQGQASAKKYFDGFKKRFNAKPIAYQVELNVNDNELLDWAGSVPEFFVEKVIADNPDMPDFVKRNIRGAGTAAEFYRYIQKWQERIVDDLNDAPKATSLLLLKSGCKGIRHQDNKSWAGDNPYGDDHYLIISGRTRHQIALADPTCKAVKTTLIDYDPAIHTDDWVQMTNAGEHIINRTATTEHYRTYFTHNPITHAQAIEQGLVPIDPRTGNPTAAYTKGRQLAIFKDGQYSHASQQDADVLTGEVPVNLITHSEEVPQFKTNKAGNRPGKDGVVYALPREYRTHDPIHLWHRKDGTLVIISGRHRLAKAIEAGATHIPATVYPETDERNATWARVHDAEQNVLDNQASVADTALYVKGYNPKGRPLTEEETKQFTRKGSNSELGSYIGLHGSDTLIDYLSRGAISPEYAYKIAQFAPDDPDTQNLAVAELVTLGKGIQESLTAAAIYRDTLNNRDDDFSALFQTSQQEEDFNRFLASYAASKIRTIGLKRRPHKAAASERSVREHQEAGIQFENIAHNRQALATLTAEQDKWRNPSLHPELRQEAYEEFKKTAEGAQDYFNFGSFSLRTKQEMQSVHNCVEELASGAELGILHNTAWGKDIIVPRGRYGKKGFGVEHMHEKRLLHGFTEDEAAFIIVCALKAAESTENPTKRGNKWLFDKFGIRAVVAEQKEQGNLMITGFVLGTEGKEEAVDSAAAQLAQHFYALDELSRIQQVGAALQKALSRFEKIVNNNPQTWEQVVTAIVTELQKKQNAKANGETYSGSPLDAFSQQETSVSSLSLRRRPDRNLAALLNERETTLLRVANYIKREADRTANVMGKDTELQRAGVAFAQANAIINALDTHIFPQEHITKNSEEYRRLRALRNYLSEYIRIAAKGKLPVRRTTKDGHITIKAAIRELLETQLPAARTAAQTSQNRRVAITSYREEWKREPTSSGVYGNAADDKAA